MSNLIIFMGFIISVGLLSIASKRKHLLAILLRLEIIILRIYSIIAFYITLLSLDYTFTIVFITLAVCEGRLGLSILVSIVRRLGNDNLQNLSLI